MINKCPYCGTPFVKEEYWCRRCRGVVNRMAEDAEAAKFTGPGYRSYVYTEEDYIDYNLFNVTHNESDQKTMKMMRILLPALFFVIAVLNGIKEQSLWNFIFYLLLFGIVSVFWIRRVPKIMESGVRSQFRSLKKQGQRFDTKGCLIFGFDSITDVGERKTRTSRYQELEKVCVTPKGIYLYIQGISAYMAPNSLFGSDEEKTAAVAFLQERIPAGRLELYDEKMKRI